MRKQECDVCTRRGTTSLLFFFAIYTNYCVSWFFDALCCQSNQWLINQETRKLCIWGPEVRFFFLWPMWQFFLLSVGDVPYCTWICTYIVHISEQVEREGPGAIIQLWVVDSRTVYSTIIVRHSTLPVHTSNHSTTLKSLPGSNIGSLRSTWASGVIMLMVEWLIFSIILGWEGFSTRVGVISRSGRNTRHSRKHFIIWLSCSI